MKLCTLVSGSSGNSIFLSHNGTNILIDCGVSGKQIQNSLNQINVSADEIDYILVTHEHIDHSKGVGVLSRRYDIPIVASHGTWLGMEIGEIADHNKIVFNENSQMDIGGIGVTPFDTPHDAMQPKGYKFDLGDKRIAIATDIGHINQNIKDAVFGCEIVILEANYDEDMLESGPYPYHLKKRIGGEHGHLCNVEAGELACFLVENGTHTIMLAHLSKENNSENVAFSTVARILDLGGIKVSKDVKLGIAPRYCTSAPIVI
ncbi:MAG: MBL fold metallo-hydrolase [Eubacteriales bacterium]|jgi:phosphoribosyl 1,2-cyclic phosphodiesterase|nr:MBL fold metallo-hydrolase [Eubacteriales bacterium]